MRGHWTYLILPLFPGTIFAQEKLELYRGNASFEGGNYEAAKSHYQNALNQSPSSYGGTYNKGNAAYRMQDFEDATASFQQALANSGSDKQKAQAYHNLGNSFLNSAKLDEAINAYKNALRLDPQANDTRYNLAYAQKMKKKQEQQQQQNQEQQEKNKQEEKEQQENKNQQKEEKKEEEQGKNKEQENKEPRNKNEAQKEQQAQPAKPMNLSPREAEQMLEAARNEDQKILMQLNKKDQKAQPKNIEKDW